MNLELRARAAAAILELAFNPGQRRGPDGRWIKMGGAGSAGGRPRSGRARGRRLREAARRWVDPSSAPNGPMRGEDLERLREVFDYTDRDGRSIGSATRTIRADPRTGDLVVDHVQFNLNEEAQGAGLSSRWLQNAEQAYRDAGISEIQVSATGVGGYAWAKAGFDFRGRNTMRQMADRFELRSEAPPAVYGDSERARQQMRDLAARARSRDPEAWPLPVEFAMIGWEPGATTWPGKDGMLGTNWGGVKRL